MQSFRAKVMAYLTIRIRLLNIFEAFIVIIIVRMWLKYIDSISCNCSRHCTSLFLDVHEPGGSNEEAAVTGGLFKVSQSLDVCRYSKMQLL